MCLMEEVAPEHDNWNFIESSPSNSANGCQFLEIYKFLIDIQRIYTRIINTKIIMYFSKNVYMVRCNGIGNIIRTVLYGMSRVRPFCVSRMYYPIFGP